MTAIFDKLLSINKLIEQFRPTFKVCNKQQIIKNSPNSNQALRDQYILNQNFESIPEVQMNLYGCGAKETFEGDITNKSDKSVILQFIEINEIRTDLNQTLNKLIFIRDNKIQYPEEIFNNEQNVLLKLRYKNIDGNIYEANQNGKKELRVDGKFNIVFDQTQYRKIN